MLLRHAPGLHAGGGSGRSAATAVAAPAPSAPMMNDRRPPDRGPAPRAHAKQETFVEGDHVVYPTHGVGKVERIATEEIAGHKLELIHITFEENRMTLRVPVAKAPHAPACASSPPASCSTRRWRC